MGQVRRDQAQKVEGGCLIKCILYVQQPHWRKHQVVRVLARAAFTLDVYCSTSSVERPSTVRSRTYARFRIDCARLIFVDVEGSDPAILFLYGPDGRDGPDSTLLLTATSVRDDLNPSRSIFDTDADDLDLLRSCSATVVRSVFGMTGRSSILIERLDESGASRS